MNAAESFDMAMRETVKAWTSTSMLTHLRAPQCQALVDAACSADPAKLADMLRDMAGPAYAKVGLDTGLDATKAATLGQHVVHAALLDISACAQEAGPQEVSEIAATTRLKGLVATMRDWVATGASPGGPTGQLGQLNALLKDQASARLGVVAGIVPALATGEIVLRAISSGATFSAQTAESLDKAYSARPKGATQ